MTPNDRKDAPDALESAQVWISCAAAAAVLGVSSRAIQKRAARGSLKARKVERGGVSVWEIDGRELGANQGANMDASIASNGREPANLLPKVDANIVPPHVQIDREQGANMDASIGGSGANLREMDASIAPDFAARYVEHLEKENDFLRRALEGAQQSEAMTKAALREALKAMPKQLTSGGGGGDLQQVATEKRAREAISGQNGTELEQVGTAPQIDQSAPKSTAKAAHEQNHTSARDDAQSGDISTYDALADWLENQL
jgi:hypothetical protein